MNDFNEVVAEFDHVPKGFRNAFRSSEFDAVQWLADAMKNDPDFDITTIEKIVLAPGVSGYPDEYVIDVTEYLDALDEGDNLSTFESLNVMRRAAGLAEAILDESGETLDHILNRFKFEVKSFEESNDLDHDLYEALFDYYMDKGEIPYGVAKGRTGDPYEWISDKFAQDLGINEGAAVDAYMAGKSPALAHFADQLDKNTEVQEGSCNMTMEGEYCPEHGLMECGMYEMGTVAGGMAPVIGEGDAVLARIKSLALIK
jgi:hypothetical protein